MLYGEYEHSLDAKGRLVIPARIREELGEKLFITKGVDDCLFILSEEAYNKMIENFSHLETEKALPLLRRFGAGTQDVVPDKQGRVLLKDTLKKYAHIEKDTVIIGTAGRAEIWDLATWDAYVNAQTNDDIKEALKGVVL